MRTRTLLSLVVATAALTLTGVPAHAQDATYARTYQVTPKDGMIAQFEAALQAHVRWRSENNDPWNWGVNTVEVGENSDRPRSASPTRSSQHSPARGAAIF